MNAARQKVLERLAMRIDAMDIPHPVRVAIDGIDTSGKTSLANELVAPLRTLGRPVIRASIDRFHRPRAKRYARGADSPEGYYYDSFDHTTVIERLLRPLGESPPTQFVTAAFDYRTDTPVHELPQTAKPNSVLLFDGVFLMREELNPYWDFRVFVDIPFEEAVRRAKRRDRDYLGDEIEAKYRNRYIPGQELYLDSAHPSHLADIVLHNSDIERPTLAYRPVAIKDATIDSYARSTHG